MASDLFDAAADALERHSSLDRLEARGTLRIALKAAGLAPNALILEQLAVVLERVLPGELATRGVEDGAAVCAAVMTSVKGSAAAATAPAAAGSVDDVFRRLGGD